MRDDERLYRVDRLQGPVELAGEATHPVGVPDDPGDLRGWELGDGDPVVARVRIDADQAPFARHLVGEVTEEDDGSVVATLDVRNPEAFRSFVIGFLDHAEVLDPPELRAEVVDWLEALA